MSYANPILVEVTRGGAVESFHRGAAVVVDAAGAVVGAWGNVDHPVYPRSAIKPLQAVPLITTGAAATLGVTMEEIALACASHNGESVHTEAVEQWLKRIGYGPETLECGAHPPADGGTRRAMQQQDVEPSPLHNNCSGKHAGFLTVCRHLEFDPAGYIRADHPVQRLVRDAVSAFTGCNLEEARPGVDGCGIPVYAVPLRGLATAMTRFARPEGLDPETAEAARLIRDAMINHPYLVAGHDRFCTRIMETLAPNVLVKTGAEGVFCAAVMDRGLGIAVKIDDGAGRASEVAVGGVLRALEAIDETRFLELSAKLQPEIRNVAGATVGEIRASETLVAGA